MGYSKNTLRNGLLLSFLLQGIVATAQLKIDRALCENKIDPFGVATRGIRFSWELGSTGGSQYQRAYQLVISSSPQRLASGVFDVHRGDTIKSDQNILVD